MIKIGRGHLCLTPIMALIAFAPAEARAVTLACGTNTCTSDSTAVNDDTAGNVAFTGSNTDSTNSTSIGVEGIASAGDGVRGNSSSGNGVYGTTNTSSTNYAGVFGKNTDGGYGVYGASSGSGGVGGYFTSEGITVAAVYGLATGSGGCGVLAQGPGYGLWGTSTGDGVHAVSSGSGRGVYGVNNSTGNGVEGIITGATSGRYAVYGNDESGGGWAGYFTGGVSVSQEFWVGGVCEFGCPSDARLKRDVQPLSGALDRILQLHGVTFEWKDPAARGHQEGIQTGFIAQEVEKVFPTWVEEDKKGNKTLTIDYKVAFATSVEGLRELKIKSDTVQVKIDKQQAEIDELKVAIARLKNGTDPISRTPGFGTGALALFAAGFAGAAGSPRFTRSVVHELKCPEWILAGGTPRHPRSLYPRSL